MTYRHTIACSITFTFESEAEDWRVALDEVITDEVPFKDLTPAEKWEWFEEQAPGSLDDYLTLVSTTSSEA
ncbi:MAG: hypothetical protein VKI81_06300 [Synechococcaceae cyanobacterium]|nr:hypothetical protein [Synechococcaceae cyanobacterium]